jgi:hypothetical protein
MLSNLQWQSLPQWTPLNLCLFRLHITHVAQNCITFCAMHVWKLKLCIHNVTTSCHTVHKLSVTILLHALVWCDLSEQSEKGRATGKRIKELWFNSQGENKCFLSPKNQAWLCKQPIQCGSRALSPVGKAVVSAEVKNGWSYTSTPICIYGVHRHNSYLIYRNVQAVCAEWKRKKHKSFQAHRMNRTKALMWGSHIAWNGVPHHQVTLTCYIDNLIHNGLLFLSVAIMCLHIFRVQILQGRAAKPNATLVGVQRLIVLVVA